VAKKKKASWKTTVCGILGFLAIASVTAVALIDGNPDTVANWEAVAASFMAMLGLFMARDADKSSEDAGLR